jgi:hypothetical protein
MLDAQDRRMQCQSWGSTAVFQKIIERTAIFDVTANRMSEFCQVNSNLIGAARLQSAFQFAVAPQNPQSTYVGHRLLTDGCIAGASSNSVTAIPNQL